jgi:hypothetical protein
MAIHITEIKDIEQYSRKAKDPKALYLPVCNIQVKRI